MDGLLNSVPTKDIKHTIGDAHRLFAQFLTVCRQAHDGLARIHLTFRTIDDALAFHTLNKGRHRVGFQCQALSNVVDRQLIYFPKHHQHQILRISHAQLVQIRTISLRDEAACGVEPKAKLLVEFQFFVVHVRLFLA